MNFMNKFLLLLLFNSGSLFGSYELINSDNAESNTAFLFVHGLDGSKHQGLYYCNKYTNKDGILKQNKYWVMQEPYAFFNFSEVASKNYKEVDLGQAKEMELLHQAYCKTRELLPNHKIAVFGVSRGAATAINWAATYQPSHLCALVLESPFDHIHSIIGYLTKKWKLHWIPHIHQFSAYIFKKRFPSLDLEGPVPQKTVQKLPLDLPILLIHSHKDELIPLESSRALYVQLCNAGHKKAHFVELSEGKHAQLFKHHDADLYHRTVHSFFKRYHLPYDLAINVTASAA